MSFRWRNTDIDTEATLSGETITLRHADGTSAEFAVEHVRGPEWLLRRDGIAHAAVVARSGANWWVHVDGRTHVLTRAARVRVPAAESSGVLTAPMTGTVVAVQVKEGQAVAAGDPILVLSAMKMQVEIKAPRAGHVTGLTVKAGQQVEGGQVLATIQVAAAASIQERPSP